MSKKYQNQDFETFIDVLKQFLQDANATSPPITACFAVAGPVKDNVVRFVISLSSSLFSTSGKCIFCFKIYK